MKCSICGSESVFEIIVTKHDFSGSEGYLKCHICGHRTINYACSQYSSNGDAPIKDMILEQFQEKEF